VSKLGKKISEARRGDILASEGVRAGTLTRGDCAQRSL